MAFQTCGRCKTPRTQLTGTVAVFAATLLALPVHAEQGPAEQRRKELSAIIDSQEVQTKLKGHVIRSIHRAQCSDSYVVGAGPMVLTVRIVDTPEIAPGIAPAPRSFRLEVGEPKTAIIERGGCPFF